jgi:hypothetical protein
VRAFRVYLVRGNVRQGLLPEYTDRVGRSNHKVSLLTPAAAAVPAPLLVLVNATNL